MKRDSLLAFIALIIFTNVSIFFSQDSFTGKDTVITRSYFVTANKKITLKDSKVDFKNIWRHSSGSSKLQMTLENTTATVFGECEIDNNMSDLINARPIFINGTPNKNDTIRFLEGFNADHTGYDTNFAYNKQPRWVSFGFSSLRMGNIVYVTQASQNHKSIHKKQGNRTHTHHGLLGFNSGTSSWVIEKNDQWSDVAVRIDSPLILVTKKNLSFKGKYEWPYVGVSWGSFNGNIVDLTKKGKAGLILSGDITCTPGSIYKIKEGYVDFRSNPGSVTVRQARNIGPHLNIVADNGTRLQFSKVLSEINSLSLVDTLVFSDNGHVTLKDSCNIKGKMVVKGSIKEPLIYSDTTISVDVELDIEGAIKDTILIAESSKEVVGTFTHSSGAYKPYKKDGKLFAIRDASVGIEEQTDCISKVYQSELVLNLDFCNKVHQNVSIFDFQGRELKRMNSQSAKERIYGLKPPYIVIIENQNGKEVFKIY